MRWPFRSTPEPSKEIAPVNEAKHVGSTGFFNMAPPVTHIFRVPDADVDESLKFGRIVAQFFPETSSLRTRDEQGEWRSLSIRERVAEAVLLAKFACAAIESPIEPKGRRMEWEDIGLTAEGKLPHA